MAWIVAPLFRRPAEKISTACQFYLREPESKLVSQSLTPVWSRQELNISESRALAALRDTLLPKLLSGEVRFQMLLR